MNQINFTANFVTNATILKKEKCYKPYKKEDAAIVELDVNDEKDMNALGDATDEWALRGGEYIQEMYDNIVYDYFSQPNIIKTHYYALTTQKDDFKNLQSGQILGVTVFNEKNDDNNELEWLEVEPTTKHSVKYRKYKGIGKALVDFLSDKFPQKPYQVLPAKESIKFYRKLELDESEYEETGYFIHR